MKRFSTYMLVAAMAVSGAGFAVAADTDINVNRTNTEMAGNTQADAATQREARNTLAKVINDGVTADKFDNLRGFLAKDDKDRLADMKTTKVDDLNVAINQFRADFKNKYNQEFDIQGDHLSNAMVLAGQDKKSATVTLSNADLGASNLNNNGAIDRTTVDRTSTINNPNYTPANKPAPGMTDGAPADRVLNTPPGTETVSNRNGAMSGAADNSSTSGKATGPASNGSNANSTVHGNDTMANPGVKAIDNSNTMTTNTTTSMPPAAGINGGLASAAGAGTTLNLVNEGHIMNAWRINIPDQISAEQLKQNLTKHIQMLDDQKATWPSDVNAAYRATASHVLQAFSDSSLASER